MSGRNPPSYCTLTLIAMQGHQQKGRQTNTSSNNKDKSDTIIEMSTTEDHDDENLHNPSTRPRYSPGSRRRAVCRRSHKAVRGKRKELGSSLHTCQGYDTQMLLMHGLSYGPGLTRNTKERASVCQSDQVGLRPPRVTSHTILTRTIFSSVSFIPNCRAGFISSLDLLAERTPAPFYQSFLQSSCRAGLYDCTLVSVKMI